MKQLITVLLEATLALRAAAGNDLILDTLTL